MNGQHPVADTGFVVAIANRRDSHHAESVQVYEQFTRIYLPQTVLAETAFLIVDASVMALAERLNCTTVLILDRRDFMLYQPATYKAFTLLP